LCAGARGQRSVGRHDVSVCRGFERSSTSVGDARRFVAAALASGGVISPFVVDSALLAVSELATNAVEHGGSGFEVTVDTDTAIRITVTDDCATLPELRSVDPWEVRGRGMAMVESTADRWGADREGSGKRVWWEVDLRRS
jgi:anti-sigma regulatory factor (Ser/Thr protein kinase)